MASKRIVITGIGRGLGRAMAEGFAALGHEVWGCTRSPESARALSDMLGAPSHVDVVDVADDDQVKRWASDRLSQSEPPDLVLNNAGVINTSAPIWKVPTEEFDRLIDINIKGTANVIRHFLPAMLARRQGIIVNFSSGWGRSTSPDVGPYCASKWAIEGLTRSLAQELPSSMAAIPLNPGIIHTDMLERCFGAAASGYPSNQQWARQAIPFILNLHAGHNGQPLTVPQ
ncbi:MAG: SDR family NAD(P)-dependent oxidoreductase [Cyanobacteria bacterium J06639_1]